MNIFISFIKTVFLKMFNNYKTRLFALIIFGILFIIYIFNAFKGKNKLGSDFSESNFDSDLKQSIQVIPINAKLTDLVYGIMFDAGSTGSRMHVFSFKNNSDGTLVLVDDFFKSIKPGLSHYAKDPRMAANSLKGMLNESLNYVPKAVWSKTMLALKATAGLRLLSNKTSAQILNEVIQLFKSYPYKTIESSVKILEGSDEGLFSWFTVNYLHKYLDKKEQSVGTLDLGGGSTQITYLANNPKPDTKDLYNVILSDKKQTIYTHSYLGLGIMEVRFRLLGGKQNKSEDSTNKTLTSVCFPKLYTGNWQYAGKSHLIKTSNATNAFRFKDCLSQTQLLLSSFQVEKPEDLPFHAMSFFYDRALDAELINKSANSALLKVGQFTDAAKRACSTETSQHPFLCLDLCYISSLLNHAYAFSPSKKIMVENKVRSFEIAWPLGAMFEMFGKFYRTAS